MIVWNIDYASFRDLGGLAVHITLQLTHKECAYAVSGSNCSCELMWILVGLTVLISADFETTHLQVFFFKIAVLLA